jgi:hypothetical protein
MASAYRQPKRVSTPQRTRKPLSGPAELATIRRELPDLTAVLDADGERITPEIANELELEKSLEDPVPTSGHS